MASGNKQKDPASESRASEQAASKSQLKRDARAMKSLATELLQLSASQLRRLPLENELLLAIQAAHSIHSHGARRRQLQYLAKLVRRADTADIVAAVEGIRSEARGLTARQHRIEAWRESLMEKGDAALGELLQHHPSADAQHLRQLIRNANREKTADKPPAAARALFRALRDLDAEQVLPPCH